MKTVSKIFNAGLSMIVVAVGLFTVPSFAASQTGGFGGRPANPDPSNPRSGSIFIYTLDRGQVKNDQIEMSNNSLSPVTMNIYAVDGIVTNTGAYTCKQNSEARTDIGKWLQVSSPQITLQPDQKQLVDFTLTMPDNADVGEHDGCIVFERADDEGTLVNNGGVRLHTRQAIRVVATVPGDLKRSVSISDFSYTNTTEQVYTVNVRNDGNVSADVDVKVSMKDLFGNEFYTDHGGYPVLPNQSLTQQFKSSNYPLFGGWYTVQSEISYDSRPGKFGTADSHNLITKTSPKKTIFLWPTTNGWIILALIIAVIALGVWWLMRRRRTAKAVHSNWTMTVMKRSTTLTNLSEQYEVSWQMIAKVNKLKAPYTIKKGDSLRLPHKPVKR